MPKVKTTNNVYIPMPVALLGATVRGKANFMTVGWLTRANAQPPMIAVFINRVHYTPAGIRENGTFSVCLPGPDMVEKTDYCGLVSGEETDKSGVFDVFYGETKTAPMIEQSPLCIECRLVEMMELPTNEIYVGEIVGVYTEEKYLTDGKFDINKAEPLLLTMPDNEYRTLGRVVGKAWSAGLKLKKAGK